MDIKEIRSLIDLMKKNGLAVFKLEKEGFKITLEMSRPDAIPIIQHAYSPPAHQPALPPAPASAAAPDAGGAGGSAANSKEIVSPMVGTFYSAPSPEAQPYVQVGQVVTPDTVICIIEAMKVMNEIKAEIAGTIVEVAAENGKAVQFGQVLFRVK